MSFNLSDYEDDSDEIYISKKKPNYVGSIYDLIEIGQAIAYSKQNKRILPSSSHDSTDMLYLGVIIENNKDQKMINALYKGFLSHDPIEISSTVKTFYMQTFIKKEFQHYKDSVKEKMPRIKKLKRLNLKMLSRHQVNILYNNFDTIINGYQDAFGYEYAQILKAQIVSTPFYIEDNGIIKIYSFEKNELTMPEYEGANFLCYFTYKY